jgi:hypothetical protein
MIDSRLDQMQIGQSVALAIGRGEPETVGSATCLRLSGPADDRSGERLGATLVQPVRPTWPIATKFHFGICGARP